VFGPGLVLSQSCDPCYVSGYCRCKSVFVLASKRFGVFLVFVVFLYWFLGYGRKLSGEICEKQ
jgi:hypothetical protein